MKAIGLIGGMSWESTSSYYELINKRIKEKLGGLHSGEIWLHSVDFNSIEEMQQNGDWEKAGNLLGNVANKLENSGSEAIALCTNTMHKVSNYIEEKTNIPFLHIANATASAIKKDGVEEVLLLGTRFTMQEKFYKDMLQKSDIIVEVPNDDECQIIDKIIFEELCLGNIKKESKNIYLDIIKKCTKRNPNIQGVIFGCTEIGLLINQNELNIKAYDTTTLHVNNIVDFMLS